MITRRDERDGAIAALVWALNHIAGELDEAVKAASAAGHRCAVPIAAAAWSVAHLASALEAELDRD